MLSTVEKQILKFKEVKRRIYISMIMAVIFPWTVFAQNTGGEGVTEFNTLIEWIAEWVGRIGLVVAFIGGIYFALGFRNDNPDAKITGMKTLGAGFMVFALSKSLTMFGIGV